MGAIGTGGLNYQWFRDGVEISTASGPTLELPVVQLSDAGFYSVVVSSPFGSITNSAQVVVNPAGTDLGMYAGIRITGAAGYSYQIQYSTNLTDTSVDALGRNRRYYRILPGP